MGIDRPYQKQNCKIVRIQGSTNEKKNNYKRQRDFQVTEKNYPRWSHRRLTKTELVYEDLCESLFKRCDC